MRTMTCGVLLLSSLLASGAVLAAPGSDTASIDNDARIAELMYPPAHGWDKVEAIRTASVGTSVDDIAGRYDGFGGELLLAPDGRMAIVFEVDGDQAEVAGLRGNAVLGQWRVVGNWMELSNNDVALQPTDAIPTPEQLAEFRTMLEGMAPYLEMDSDVTDASGAAAKDDAPYDESAAIDAYARQYASTREAQIAMAGSDPWDADTANIQRYLLVELPEGRVMLDANTLMWHAQRWDGEGSLELTASYWRAPGKDGRDVAAIDSPSTFHLADPMHAGVPQELRSLLRTGVIEPRVAATVDPSAIEWFSHSATVTLTLDQGSDDGLLESMTLYGRPPFDSVNATVTRVSKSSAEAEIHISRFAPDDTPAVPPQGAVFATRALESEGCGIDTGAAVRAKVTATRPASFGTDADGFVFTELEIDQGSRHGLAVGDSVMLEPRTEGDHDYLGEGRVRRVGETSATVLWRGFDYAAAEARHTPEAEGLHASVDGNVPATPAFPEAGRHLITSGWQQAEWELFGSQAQQSPVDGETSAH